MLLAAEAEEDDRAHAGGAVMDWMAVIFALIVAVILTGALALAVKS